MKISWSQAAARVDAMSLRERFLLFLAVVAVLAALTQMLFIAPLTRLQAQRAAQIDLRSADTEQQISRMQVEMLARRRDHASELTAQIASVDAELAAIESELAALAESSGEAVALPALLRRVLKRSDKVSLLRVASADEGRAAPLPGALPPGGGGLDVTLAGNYLDLMEYLASLEAALPLARWSAVRVSAETAPTRVTARVAIPRGAK